VAESEALISVPRGAHGGARVQRAQRRRRRPLRRLVLELPGHALADIHNARTIIERLRPPAGEATRPEEVDALRAR